VYVFIKLSQTKLERSSAILLLTDIPSCLKTMGETASECGTIPLRVGRSCIISLGEGVIVVCMLL